MVREALFGRHAETIGGIRIRSRDISRLEGMTDAALGFAITLLIVSQEVPQSYDDLIQMLYGFPAFAVTFMLVMFIWYWHNIFFRTFGLLNGRVTFVSCLLMFLVLALVFPLKFLANVVIGGLLLTNVFGLPVALDLGGFTGVEAGHLHVIFALGHGAVFLTMAWLYNIALGARTLLELTPVELNRARLARTSFLIVAGVGLVSIVPALTLRPGLNAMVAGYSMILIWPLQHIYARWMVRREPEETPDGAAVTP